MLIPGQTLDRFQIIRKLAAGGLGVVYEAFHIDAPGRRYAIKLLNQEAFQKPEIAARFIREARVMLYLDHPSIVKVFDLVQIPDSYVYIVMEFVDGQTLRKYLEVQGGRIHPLIIAKIFRQLSMCLQYAHEQNIIHRDLKLPNVMISADSASSENPVVKLLDFGIAKARGDNFTEIGTSNQIIMGTLDYMAPEQFTNPKNVDSKADVYSLGVMLYCCLSGKLPFSPGQSLSDHLAVAHYYKMHTEASPPELPKDIPAALVSLTHDMMAKASPRRPSMRDITKSLDDFENQSTRSEISTHISNATERPTVMASKAHTLEPLLRPTSSQASLFNNRSLVIVTVLAILWAMTVTLVLLVRR